MSEDGVALTGAARAQGELWEERARDWADVMEGWSGWGIPIYRHVLERVRVDGDTDLLDVGCGAGRFCRMAADRGARCAGLDATAPFIEIARSRVPGADLRVGDMEDLPWADGSFDVVTGFNSFFIASDMAKALGEAGRVSRPGASVAMTVFGRPEQCQSTAVFASLKQLMPKQAGNKNQSQEQAPLHAEGMLEDIATGAGLAPTDAGYISFTEDYPDLETMLRGYLAAAPFVRAARMAGSGEVRAVLAEALGQLRATDGRYRLTDEVRYLIATA